MQWRQKAGCSTLELVTKRGDVAAHIVETLSGSWTAVVGQGRREDQRRNFMRHEGGVRAAQHWAADKVKAEGVEVPPPLGSVAPVQNAANRDLWEQPDLLD